MSETPQVSPPASRGKRPETKASELTVMSLQAVRACRFPPAPRARTQVCAGQPAQPCTRPLRPLDGWRDGRSGGAEGVHSALGKAQNLSSQRHLPGAGGTDLAGPHRPPDGHPPLHLLPLSRGIHLLPWACVGTPCSTGSPETPRNQGWTRGTRKRGVEGWAQEVPPPVAIQVHCCTRVWH